MHGYAHPEHERRVAELARAAGFSQVSVSHETSPLMKLVGRGETTVVDAYLSPILRRYVDGVAAQLGDVRPALHAVARRPHRRARCSAARTRSSPGRRAAWSARSP